MDELVHLRRRRTLLPCVLVLIVFVAGFASAPATRASLHATEHSLEVRPPRPSGPPYSESLPENSGTLADGPAASTSIGSVVTTIAVGDGPLYGAYDPENGYVYVGNEAGVNVSVLSGTHALRSIPVGFGPWAVQYDPSDGYVYVGHLGIDNITVVNGTAFLAFIPTGGCATSEVWDTASGYLYSEAGGGSCGPSVVTAVEGTHRVKSIDTGATPASPEGATYDPLNHYVYVPEYGGKNVTVIKGQSIIASVDVGRDSAPIGAVFDSTNGYVYVADAGTDSVSVINGTRVIASIHVGTDPFPPCFDPANGFVYVPNYVADTVSVIRGLSLAATVTVGSFPINLTYDPDNGLIYVANLYSNNVSVIDGVALAGTLQLAGPEPNGVGPYSLTFDPRTGDLYVMDAGDNNVSVIGFPTLSHRVTFRESGLPPGTRWSTVFDGRLENSTRPSMSFLVRAGNYSYFVPGLEEYTVSAPYPSGTVLVFSNQTNVSISFSPGTTYPLIFEEVGLKGGTTWCATLGWTICSSTSTIEFTNLSDGSYPFEIVPVFGFNVKPAVGSVGVNGPGLRVDIQFETD